MQTHQISAFNSASFRHFFLNQKTRISCPPLQSFQLAKGVVYRIVLPVMTSMTLRSLFPNSVLARFLRYFCAFEALFHCKNSIKFLKHRNKQCQRHAVLCKTAIISPGLGFQLIKALQIEKKRIKWVNFVRHHRANFFIGPEQRFAVCSEHFALDCFHQALAFLGSQRRLKAGPQGQHVACDSDFGACN